MELERGNSSHNAYIESIPSMVSLVLGGGVISRRLRKFATHLISPLTPTPVIDIDSESWACKNAALFAQMYMIAATAHGLSTCAMEGFDARRLYSLFHINPDEYSIPMIIATGYRDSNYREPIQSRFNMKEVFFSDFFGVAFNVDDDTEKKDTRINQPNASTSTPK